MVPACFGRVVGEGGLQAEVPLSVPTPPHVILHIRANLTRMPSSTLIPFLLGSYPI